MIKAIIFDWGGVLISDPTWGVVSYCAKYFKVQEEKLYRTQRKFKLDFQKGKTSESIFWKNICSELGIQKSVSHSLWKQAFASAYEEKNEVFSIATSLKKKGLKIGFLSNTELPAMEFFLEQRYDLFDAAVFSCVEGRAKPDPKIYKIILKRLQAKPEESLFIDDKEEFVHAARNLGMNAIVFLDIEQVKNNLFSYLNDLSAVH